MPIFATHAFGGIVTATDINAMATAINTNEVAIAARWARILTKRTITGNYTLVAADAIDMVLHSTSATAINITLPQDSAATIAQDISIPWRQYGAGQLTFIAGAGAVVTARGGALKSTGQYTEGWVTKVAANAWVVSGSIVTSGGAAPTAPTSVTAVAMHAARVRVMWTAPTTGTVIGYKVYRGGVLQASLTGTTTNAHLDTPTKKEVAQEIVCTAENSSLDWRAQYGYLEDIGDGRGYTGGIIGFTSGTSDMLTLVQLYNVRSPGNVLQPYTQALINVNGTASHAGLDPGFQTAWATAAFDATFRSCQDDERDRVYFGPAVAQGVADGLRGLGQFIYYDTYVNHGPGSDEDSFGGILAEAKSRSSPPAQGGTEAAYLTDFIQARKESLIRFGYTEFTRTDTQNGFVTAGKFDLIPPLSWNMYGDPFTIAGQPWVDTTTAASTAYSYTVTAVGFDGLESVASSSAAVTTPADQSKAALISLISNVTTANAYVYTAKDSSNNTMDTVKVIDDPDGGYFAVYHSGSTVRLARSTNLTTWTSPVTLDTASTQPTIRALSTGGFIVGMEYNGGSGGQIRIKHYVNRAALLAGTANLTYTATRSLSPCNEGTPHFDSVTLNPDINTSVITVGMHHHECDQPWDTDRQSVGTLTNFNSWSAVKTPAVSTALVNAAAAAGQTVNGNIGDRDNLTWGGVKYGIHEVQYNFGPTGQNNSFASWRAYLYDYSTSIAQLLTMTTHAGSTAFANPSWSLITNPTGQPAIVVCLFIPVEGAGTNEAGPCIFWKTLPT